MSLPIRNNKLERHSSWLEVRSDCVNVHVRAKPGSSRRGVLRAGQDALVIGLSSPPEKGRANEELIEFIARAAGVPRSAVQIVRGASARIKVLQITTRDPTSTYARLSALVRDSGH